MALYEFVCATCGTFELNRPISGDTASAACPTCSAASGRSWTSPATRLLAPGMRRMLDAQDASRHEPQVVSAVPGRERGSGPRVTTDPRHRRLPRP